MHTTTAFGRRERLTDEELARLSSALKDELDRYKIAIRGYTPEKIERYGKPYLQKLEDRVAEVERLRQGRSAI
jgi:hypothetical protein